MSQAISELTSALSRTHRGYSKLRLRILLHHVVDIKVKETRLLESNSEQQV